MHTRQKIYAFEVTVVWLYQVFPHYLLNNTIFGVGVGVGVGWGELLNIKCALVFSTTFV